MMEKAGTEKNDPREGDSVFCDAHGRVIHYVRLSLTDRCNIRCKYCLPSSPSFEKATARMTPDEAIYLCRFLTQRGVKKIRLTGGEPLTSKNFAAIATGVGRLLEEGNLKELTLTTNGMFLKKFVPLLIRSGIKRINVSLDTLDHDAFKTLTRGGSLTKVLAGIDEALKAGIQVKINTVVMKDYNADHIHDLIFWVHEKGMDISLIEIMPMAETFCFSKDQMLSLAVVREKLESHYHVTEVPSRLYSGPSRYVRLKETGRLVGFISPISEIFCAACNRIRITSTGMLYPCLGHNGGGNILPFLREGCEEKLEKTMHTIIQKKPKVHLFAEAYKENKPAVSRMMAQTGG